MQPIQLQVAPILIAALVVFSIFDLLPHPALRRGVILSTIARVQAALGETAS